MSQPLAPKAVYLTDMLGGLLLWPAGALEVGFLVDAVLAAAQGERSRAVAAFVLGLAMCALLVARCSVWPMRVEVDGDELRCRYLRGTQVVQVVAVTRVRWSRATQMMTIEYTGGRIDAPAPFGIGATMGPGDIVTAMQATNPNIVVA